MNQMLTDVELEAQLNQLELQHCEPYRPFVTEYEEVTLVKSNSAERLGLTVCHGPSDDDKDTEIFIDDVEQGSLAHRSGRIFMGDQILQINGVGIRQKEQAMNLFNTDRTVVLLLARLQENPAPYVLHSETIDDGCFLDESNDTDIRISMNDSGEYQIQMSDVKSRGSRESRTPELTNGTTSEPLDDTMNTTSCNHEKDSGVGRVTDESTKNGESSASDLNLSDDYTNIHQQLNRTNVVSDSSVTGVRRSMNSIDEEIAELNQEMENIKVECEQLVEKHRQEKQQTCSSSSSAYNTADSSHSTPVITCSGKSPGDIRRPPGNPQQQVRREAPALGRHHAADPGECVLEFPPGEGEEAEAEVPDCDIMYTTYDNLHHTILLQQQMFKQGLIQRIQLHEQHSHTQQQHTSQYQPAHRAEQYEYKLLDGTPVFMSPLRHLRRRSLQEQCRGSPSRHSTGERSPHVSSKYHSPRRVRSASNTPQNSPAKYHHGKHHQHSPHHPHPHLNQRQHPHPQYNMKFHCQNIAETREDQQQYLSGNSSQTEEVHMEWKVKRRADGTRYICRRPVRNRLLKERAHQLQEERAGLTTDDDMMSELKLGKYWSKEDRKRHLEKARDQKRRKEFMIQRRLDVLQEGQEGFGGTSPVHNIVDLSQKKAQKRKGKKMLDDFVTVQEILAHGNKVTKIPPAASPLTPLNNNQSPHTGSPHHYQKKSQQQQVKQFPQYDSKTGAPILSVTTV